MPKIHTFIIAGKYMAASKTQQYAIDFVKLKSGQTLTISTTGTEQEAKAYIQTVRVQLSRLRHAARRRGLRVRHFRLFVNSVTYTKATNTTVTTITKETPRAAIEDAVDAAFISDTST